jgi:hypothetical protein
MHTRYPMKLIALIEEKVAEQRQFMQFDVQKVAQFMESRGNWVSIASTPKRR